MDIDCTCYFSMKFRPLGSSLVSLCSQHPTPSPPQRLEGPFLLTSTALAREHIFSLLSLEAFSYFWITDNWSVLSVSSHAFVLNIFESSWPLYCGNWLKGGRQHLSQKKLFFSFFLNQSPFKNWSIGWGNWFLGFLNSVLWFSWGYTSFFWPEGKMCQVYMWSNLCIFWRIIFILNCFRISPTFPNSIHFYHHPGKQEDE